MMQSAVMRAAAGTAAAAAPSRRALSTTTAVARKFFVGGNWKCHGSCQQVQVCVCVCVCGSPFILRCSPRVVARAPPLPSLPGVPLVCCCCVAQHLVETLNTGAIGANTEVVVAPPALYAREAQRALRDDVGVALQDVGDHSFGAHTGNHAAEMCTDADIKYAIVGHSERRAGVRACVRRV